MKHMLPTIQDTACKKEYLWTVNIQQHDMLHDILAKKITAIENDIKKHEFDGRFQSTKPKSVFKKLYNVDKQLYELMVTWYSLQVLLYELHARVDPNIDYIITY